MEDTVVSLDPQTGNEISRQPISGVSSEEMGYIMVRNKQQNNIILGVPKNGEGKITVLDSNPADQDDTPLFFTSVSKEAAKIFGYQINTASLSCNHLWTINLGAQNKIIDVKT